MHTRDELLGRLAPVGQEHLLAFWERLDEGQRRRLADQIAQIDFDLLARLRSPQGEGEDVRSLAARAESPPSFHLRGGNRFSAAEARARGREFLARGRLATLLVAGGQGTRLGFDHPKGMYPIGPVSRHTLFQIHVEKIRAAARRYGVRIPLFLMTSPATHRETVEFFAAHHRFGLPEEDLFIFTQGTMPAVDAATGRVLLERIDQVALSPDGHGGMLAALARSGGLDLLQRRGIEEVFYFQVDNPLVQLADPEFVGYHLLSRSELSTQVIAKQDPLEKVGNVVSVDGALRIIEYSDLPDDVARRRAADGSLAIWAGSIGIHLMNVAFLRKVSTQATALPWHRASKKVAHVDAAGARVEPQRPNATKFERFVFDLLPSAARAVVVEVDAAEAFAPLKNGPQDARDTEATVQAQMVALARRWLESCGAEVAPGVPVEISPLYALDPGELGPKIKPGTRIVEPAFFAAP